MGTVADAALVVYPARRAHWAREHEILTVRDRNIAVARLAVFGVALLLAVLAFRGSLSPWWLVLPCVAFVPLLRRHDRIIRSRKAAVRLVAFYDHGLARLEDRWIGTGERGERFLTE